MSFVSDLLEHNPRATTVSKYTTVNGLLYFGAGALLVVWPDAVQAMFRDAPFVGHERAMFQLVGMATAVIGWLYIFGGRSGARQFVAASVIDRLFLAPPVLVSLALAGVFPHVLLAFAALDVALAIGACALRKN